MPPANSHRKAQLKRVTTARKVFSVFTVAAKEHGCHRHWIRQEVGAGTGNEQSVVDLKIRVRARLGIVIYYHILGFIGDKYVQLKNPAVKIKYYMFLQTHGVEGFYTPRTPQYVGNYLVRVFDEPCGGVFFGKVVGLSSKKKEKGGFGKFYRVAFEDGDVQTLGYFDILHGLFEESRVPVDVREKLDALISNKQWNKTRFLTKGIAVEDLLELQVSIAF